MNTPNMVSALLILLAIFFLVGGGFVSTASAADCSNLRCDEGSPSGDGNWDADVTSITVSPFNAMDAMHLAIAVECGAQVFLTTDDAILSSADRISAYSITVKNPTEMV